MLTLGAISLGRVHSPRGKARGFTLIELIVTITLLMLLLGLGLPSMMTWLRNSKVRTVADALQTGVRQAQADALRLNRSVVFYLTNSAPSTASIAAADVGGKNWAIVRVAQFDDPTAAANLYLTSGVLADSGSNVGVTSPNNDNAVCFNANGRISAVAAPGVAGVTCTATAKRFDVTYANSVTGEDRPLSVLVAVGGQVRMCDPGRPTLSATSPDGCP